MNRSVDILLVEDNPGDVVLTMEAFRLAGIQSRMHTAEDGEKAIAFLDRIGTDRDTPCPDLVLLDLNLPRVNGKDVLAHIKQHPALRRIPVIVLTSSDRPEDIAESYDRHANSYIIKPMEMRRFVYIVTKIDEFWFSAATPPPQ
ncbi:response regulator [Methylobrevis pamukkalensis]|uniref:Response regulator rcp1 n=1 Tax=Methylobrevis pamukkalensis TaxID=1439726 RepID=A0A1E3GXH2_9HYPH|nr:response regulator [Methylobrevis pamukkalensis]ODN68723.1 Response regulator rcp1 [Methylobrevis pamukkalensis]